MNNEEPLTKYCKVCKTTKPVYDFYKHKQTKDGYNTYCKPCDNIRSNKYYNANREAALLKQRERYARGGEYEQNRKSVARKYRESHSGQIKDYSETWAASNKDKLNANLKKWLVSNRHKRNTHQKVFKAVRAGKLIKPKCCSVCEKEGKIQGHHPDYNKPLEVIWVCYQCHNNIHKGECNGRS